MWREAPEFDSTQVTAPRRLLPLLPVALRQGLPLDLLRELVIQKHVGPVREVGQDLVEALRTLG